jgi:PAS domain S-box-containing protein
MVELVENTLQIISKISLSKCGYLLQIRSDGFKVLKIWGAKTEEFDLVNDYLFNQHLSNGIDCDSLQLSKLLTKNSYHSYFVKDIIVNNEENQVLYLLLFTDEANKFKTECKNNITSVLPILSKQVKRWLEQKQPDNSESKILIVNESEPIINDNGLLSDWEENFNHLLETSPDLVFILDKEGKFLLLNKPVFELLEYSVDYIKGKHFTEFVDLEHSLNITNLFNSALVNNSAVKFEVSLLTKYESAIPFEINCKVIKKDEEVIGMFGIGRNISDQKKYEVQLKKLKPQILEANRLIKIERTRAQQKKSLIDEMNRLKQEFVSNISHEFRTPLASIVGFSETIESDPDLPPEMKKEFNKVILSEGKRLAKLINNILNLTKFEGASIKLNRDSIDGIKLVSELVEANKDFAMQKNIALAFEKTAEEIIIEADKKHLFQALNALLNNALKFTNEYGRIKIIVSSLFREIEIVISDTGIGIPEKDLPYIFQRFYRVSRPGTDIPGTGVGLVFVKQIVDLHKGLITVQSDVGSGTTFMVKLPKTSKIEKN